MEKLLYSTSQEPNQPEFENILNFKINDSLGSNKVHI